MIISIRLIRSMVAVQIYDPHSGTLATVIKRFVRWLAMRRGAGPITIHYQTPTYGPSSAI